MLKTYNAVTTGRQRLLRLCALVALSSTTLTLVGVAPATAGPTTATVTITAGALTITVPADAGSLGSAANTVDGSTISGSLGEVQITDARTGVAGWVASAISTAFTPPSGPAIAASNVGYTAGTITKVGTATYTANDPANLTGVSPVVTATAVTGDNSATWNPTINVFAAGGTIAGTYSATITHSLV
jgi:hypothetical protein